MGNRLQWLRATVGRWSRLPFQQSGMHLVTLALGLLTVSLLINFVNQVIQSATLEARRATLQQEVQALEAENLHLRGAVEYVESDVYVERVAREQLGYAREGETVVLPRMLLPTPTPPAAPAAATAPQPTAVPNWQGWWEAFQAPAP